MKKLVFFATVFWAVLLCVGFASCNNEADDPVDSNQVEKKMCTVSINTKGIVSVEEEPLGRVAEEPADDLYLIVFRQMINSNYVTYAYGLFDNLNNITVQLVEGESYEVEAVAVKDGKNKIACNSGKYAPPFDADLKNQFVYNEQNYSFVPTIYFLKESNTGMPAQIAVGLEVYIGNMTTQGMYEAKENGDAITIKFVRFAGCAAEFKAVDMPQGSLKINISAKYGSNNNDIFTTDDIIVENVSTPNFQYITFGASLFSSIASTNGVPCTLNLTWVKNDGSEIVLMPVDINFKRDTKYNITIKVDNTTSPAITVSPIVNYNYNLTEDVNITGQPIPISND